VVRADRTDHGAEEELVGENVVERRNQDFEHRGDVGLRHFAALLILLVAEARAAVAPPHALHGAPLILVVAVPAELGLVRVDLNR
jgi:hypothetical protein